MARGVATNRAINSHLTLRILSTEQKWHGAVSLTWWTGLAFDRKSESRSYYTAILYSMEAYRRGLTMIDSHGGFSANLQLQNLVGIGKYFPSRGGELRIEEMYAK
ncbi:hypothetical protein CDAR_381891 [Caerostris darwini]|uniref:Uncharacterized protein n=1 Tax=Caerostris darwini TaxID=1538125 RepID=A0AAV4V4X8_9ARAC|nr:hypothetical protein CDAR_381891 [Caerostris darwini]